MTGSAIHWPSVLSSSDKPTKLHRHIMAWGYNGQDPEGLGPSTTVFNVESAASQCMLKHSGFVWIFYLLDSPKIK